MFQPKSGANIHERTAVFIERMDDCKDIERPLIDLFIKGKIFDSYFQLITIMYS